MEPALEVIALESDSTRSLIEKLPKLRRNVREYYNMHQTRLLKDRGNRDGGRLSFSESMMPTWNEYTKYGIQRDGDVDYYANTLSSLCFLAYGDYSPKDDAVPKIEQFDTNSEAYKNYEKSKELGYSLIIKDHLAYVNLKY